MYKYAQALPIDLQKVKMADGFWKSRIDQSKNHGLPRLLDEYERRPIVKNFLPTTDHEGATNQDEFLYKALEAAAYYLADSSTEVFKKQYRRIRDIVIAAQKPDGYLNTKTIKSKLKPFGRDSRMDFYFSGHLIQAGIAELRTTGDTTLYDAAKKYVDLLIDTFSSEEMQFRTEYGGPFVDHPNFEMAIVELYRVSGNKKYLNYCREILDLGDYAHREVLESHAVMEMLFNTGAVDYFLETGDRDIWSATVSQWNDMQKKMYVTGGVGSDYHRESFAKPYDLPNSRAYAETCANISSVFWNWRMFLATAEAKYMNLVELTLYNGVLPGIALKGHEYFYVNPLESQGYNPHLSKEWHARHTDTHYRETYWSTGRLEEWECSCCPPNIHRFLAKFQQYIYAAKQDAIWVNLFAGSTLLHKLPNGSELSLTQKTEFPWEGEVELQVSLDKPSFFTLFLRIPEYVRHCKVTVNGKPEKAEPKSGHYLEITRDWNNGDVVEAHFSMPVQLLRSHPRNTANAGKLVIRRGPLVYCLESEDHPKINIFDIVLRPKDTLTQKYDPDLLGGVATIEGDGFLLDAAGWDEHPYQEYRKWETSAFHPIHIKAIPYYAWANRSRGSMITAIPFID